MFHNTTIERGRVLRRVWYMSGPEAAELRSMWVAEKLPTAAETARLPLLGNSNELVIQKCDTIEIVEYA